MGRLDGVEDGHQLAALLQAYPANVVDVHGDVVVEQVAGGRGGRAGRSELRHFRTFTTHRHHKSTKQPLLLLVAYAHNLTFLRRLLFFVFPQSATRCCQRYRKALPTDSQNKLHTPILHSRTGKRPLGIAYFLKRISNVLVSS